MLLVTKVSKRYATSSAALFSGITLKVAAGESLAIMGASGCGKSTLLNIIAGLVTSDSGSVVIDGQETSGLAESLRDAFRAAHIGMVFQQFNLIDCLSVVDNITLPARYLKRPYQQRLALLLQSMGLEHKQNSAIGDLSGGEQQRVAIARALIHSPKLILADEPTGNLDEATSDTVADCLFNLAKTHGAALLVVTHAKEIAARADRAVVIKHGQLEPLTNL